MQCFGEAATRLCGAAAMLLGWRPNEFWDATPAELAMALQGSGNVIDSPDAMTVDALRRRFPDNQKD